jgi:putative transposase
VKYLPWKRYKPVTAGLKQIYRSASEEEGLMALSQFEATWGAKCPQISALIARALG